MKENDKTCWFLYENYVVYAKLTISVIFNQLKLKQEYKNTRLQDYKITRIQDCKIIRLQNYKITRLQDFKITRL